jgi:hypothetical protein
MAWSSSCCKEQKHHRQYLTLKIKQFAASLFKQSTYVRAMPSGSWDASVGREGTRNLDVVEMRCSLVLFCISVPYKFPMNVGQGLLWSLNVVNEKGPLTDRKRNITVYIGFHEFSNCCSISHFCDVYYYVHILGWYFCFVYLIVYLSLPEQSMISV